MATISIEQTPSTSAASERLPSEFLTYWQALERPSIRRARRAFRATFGFDLVPPDEVMLEYGHGHFDADPVAEAFVAEVYDALGPNVGRAMLDTSLKDGIDAVEDAPPTLARLMQDLDQEPAWLDHDLVERGAKVFRSFGPAIVAFEGAATLQAYTESSIAKPLSLTGAYAGDSALHRYMETCRHMFDCTEPGGLRAGGMGRAASVRVRIMHVYLRRKISSHPEWDEEAWGVPINQSDAEITLLAGGIVGAFGMRQIGHPVSNQDILALTHLWRYIGHIMGVQPRWYPTTVREAFQLAAAYFIKRAYTAGDDGRELIESYLRAFEPKSGTGWRKRARDEFNYRAQVGYARYFLPRGFYRAYDMPKPWPWALHPALQIPVNLGIGLGRKSSRRFDNVMDSYCRWRRETWWTNEMGKERSRFTAREQFRR
jgi:ER-bound oxygenase mpaB/B'/Rubber oxygenase, catalytic domain